MTLQMEKFREHLEDFAAKHKNEIKKNPQFRKQFQEMCASIGVDPLASGKGEFMHQMLLILLLFGGRESRHVFSNELPWNESIPLQLLSGTDFSICLYL